MPRKGSVRRKDASGSSSAKSAKGVTPRKIARTVVKDEDDTSQDAERSRRSSTAAQTAASVAESRVTRSRNPKREISSPAREGKAVETSASRARSSRRSTQNVNYKESDGEEEVPTAKNEDDFESNEEFDDSDSDEKNKKKARKVRSPKGRSAKPRTKSVPKTSRRGRSSRKKKDSEEEDEEEEETVELSDESDDEKDQSKSNKEAESKKGISSTPSRRKSRNAAQPPVVDVEDSEENSGRRSRRMSVKSITAEPASKRPSRNKQVKKYTEVDEEDFIEPKSEGEYEPEGKKESSRKRKRDSEMESNKRAKSDLSEADTEIKHDNDDVEKSSKEDVKENKAASEVDDQSSDEPMEIDESVPDDAKSQNEESNQATSTDENMKTDDPNNKESIKPEITTSELSQSKKPVSAEIEPKEQDEKHASEKKEIAEALPSVPEASKSDDDAKRDACGEKSHLDANIATGGEETELKASPITIEPCQQDVKKIDQKSENVILPKLHDDTFLSKELLPPATPVNGEDNRNTVDAAAAPKDAVPHKPEPFGFENQNDTVPKTNGAQDELDDKRTLVKDTLCVLPNRKHMFNRYISEDLRLSLKEGTFGIMSYNLSSGFANADKLVRELDKLQASIICLQEVSQSFFTETLQSKLDILGYKAVTNSPWSDSGLVTFYKASLFRLCNVVDIPTQSLISQALEGSDLGESEKQAVSGCYDKCGNVLITQLASVLGSHAVTVANVKIPQCSLSLNALQVCCVVRKISTLREHIKPVLICGEFNSCETEVPYQLVRNGYLSERMIEELKCRKDGAECVPLIKLLQAKCGILCCAMCSCYNTVLGRDVELPKQNTARDILWASADNLHIIGVLDASSDSVDLKNDHRISLKADVAFFV